MTMKMFRCRSSVKECFGLEKKDRPWWNLQSHCRCSPLMLLGAVEFAQARLCVD